MYNSAGQAGLVLDTSSGNFYDGVAHNFRNATGSTTSAAFDATGTYNASGSWTVFSDESLKSDIAPYSRGLSAIQALCPVSFKYASGPFASDETRYGLVAQDMQTVVPEMVSEVNFGGERFLGMQPGMLIWLLVNSCRELAARVEALEGGK
jgi:hypothetical protein